MPYVRLTIARPRAGQESRLEEILREMNRFSAEQPGNLQQMLLRPQDDSGDIARIAIYQSEADADQVANTDRMLSLRAELHLACEPGHVERAFVTAD